MNRGFIYLILAPLLWSGNLIAGRVLSSALPPLLLNGIRWSVSAGILWLIFQVQGRQLLWKAHWKPLLLLGIVGMFLFSSLTYLGLAEVPAAQAGMISGLIPVAIVLFSMLILRERPPLVGWLGIACSVVGVLILMTGENAGTHWVISEGDVELLLAALAWGLYTVLGKKFSAILDPLTMTAGAAFYGALPSIVMGIASLGRQPMHMNFEAWVALLYVSTVASVAAYFVWTAGVHLVGAGRSAPFMNLLPIWTVLLGMVILHERIHMLQWVGGVIVILGAFMTTINPSKPAH